MAISVAQTGRATLAPSPKNLEELHLFTMPAGATDRLNFVTWDTIEVLGQGEDTVELRGYYEIERKDPTSADWPEASVDIFMRVLHVEGVSQKFGRIRATVNRDNGKTSGGQVQSGTIHDGIVDSPKMCEMRGYMRFELPDAGATVFNKEPIVLQHTITHIPPVGQGGGTRGRVDVPLYRADDPDGAPIAVLHQVRTHIGAWLND